MLPNPKMLLKNNQEDKVNLKLVREICTDKSTIGRLYLNKEYVCDTLENPYINNERNISCIPEGTYDVRLRLARESASRNYLHLLVQEVPNRSYILFHRGNTAKDTLGCILVGTHNEQDFVSNSKDAMDLLISEILKLGGENIKLSINKK